jgi:hypothetical protein
MQDHNPHFMGGMPLIFIKMDTINEQGAICSSSWGLNLIMVRRFEYTEDPKSYTSSSVATGRASHAGKVEG